MQERAVLALRQEGHPDRSLALGNLANSLKTRFQHGGTIADLDEAILLEFSTLELRPEGHPDRSLSLGNLAICHGMCFERGGGMADLEDAVSLGRATLELRPEGHQDRSLALGNLANSLRTRFQHCGRIADLDEAILLEHSALELRPEDHQERSLALGNLANSLRTRFRHGGNIADLDEAILLERSALKLRPEGHPDCSLSLGNLSMSLEMRFNRGGNMDDLEGAISLGRAALQLRPEGHLRNSFLLYNLSGCLQTRFQHSGRMADLEEAITLAHAAFELRPDGHPDRPLSLGNLSISLHMRFQHGERMEDLDSAISLGRAALDLLPEGHPERCWLLGNLANSIRTRFHYEKRITDLEETVILGHAALDTPECHEGRSFLLSNLAISLRARFEHSGQMEDLDGAISLGRSALILRLDGHPYRSLSLGNLAMSLGLRFDHTGRTEDLEEAISLGRSALALQQESHPNRSPLLIFFSENLYSRFLNEGGIDNLKESTESLILAAVHPFSSLSSRLSAVHKWIAMAQSHDPDTLLEVHRTAVSLLQRTLIIKPDLSSQHKFLCSDRRYRVLALDAASYAIARGEVTQAIEFLEQGRAFLWSQMRGFRTPLERLSEVDRTLAERFGACSRRLEALITLSESHATGSGMSALGSSARNVFQEQRSVDEAMAQIRRLSEEQEATIDDIRCIPGFENFLRASPFEFLQQAASEGPVIVLNHSVFRCDAIIVLARENDPCVCIRLYRGFYFDAIELHEELTRIRKKSGVGSRKYDEVLRRVMKMLWETVVSKFVQKLKEVGFNEGSRIWWCPTSVLSAFPFHAAGPYKGADGSVKYLLDDYISSYIPTLTSLITARSGAQNVDERMLFVGDTSLPATKKERDAIVRIRRFKQLLGDRATPEAVLGLLQEAQWAHFTCHGLLKDEPFNSSLKLSGGKLTLLDIAHANLPHAEFAFLSACHTAEQGPKFALDEALHLAAGMQFCGFRSVVDTMWQLLDKDGPFLAGAVYGL